MEGGFLLNSFSENFLNKLSREGTVWIQIIERQTSKQSAGEWMFSWGGMKAWRHGRDPWGGTCLIVVKEAPIPSADASSTYHCIPPRDHRNTADRGASEVSRRWWETPVTGAVSAAPSRPRISAVTSIPTQDPDCHRRRLQAKHTNKGATLFLCFCHYLGPQQTKQQGWVGHVTSPMRCGEGNHFTPKSLK